MSKKRKNVVTMILSFIFTIFLTIGSSFIISDSLDAVIKHPIITMLMMVISFIILNAIITFLFNKLDNYEVKEKKNDKKTGFISKMIDKHPFWFSLIVILLFWLIYIIAFYPAIMSPDPSFQILQFFGIDNKYSTYVNLIDKSVIITNHHPVIHTLLIGSCVKLGVSIFNSTNAGLFIYSIIQTLILASTLSYTIKFLKEINVSVNVRKAVLLIYALVPVFPFYAMSPVKDVIFGCLIILYIISIYKFIKLKNKINVKTMIKEIILMILITLFRNNGIHIIILSFPFLLLLGRKNLMKYLIIFIVVVLSYFTYDKVILPHFKITPGSVREMLSIPFQQTARYVIKNDDKIPEKDKKAIDKILEYDTLKKRYDPEKADDVKNKFNKDATDRDLKNYFIVWFKELKDDPKTYVEATLNNTYGYFYPVKTNWYIYVNENKTINNYGFDYHFNNLNVLRSALMVYGLIFPYIPFLGLIVNIGFNTWILLFMMAYLIYRKKYKEIIYLIPSIIVLLVCFASPVNTYFRYALPNVFAMPTMLLIFLNIRKEESLNEKN
ncbi:MAG TPA: hypothetical protein IAB68_04990 [Candidatus Aphodocola excrementigallinarum]|uniref:Uncharacterized protein n=1 Tax=Candidatus Aphodocola excrementigallinarum TaxID=2840670 RepID=A0A9D1IQ03_9FIRM|nr:hypothetical protein [Candidatus Aphodocola excrementigallinarum]